MSHSFLHTSHKAVCLCCFFFFFRFHADAMVKGLGVVEQRLAVNTGDEGGLLQDFGLRHSSYLALELTTQLIINDDVELPAADCNYFKLF